MATGTAQVHIADMKGGDGAADYMVKVAGDMNAQVAGSDRSLNYTSVSGGGLEQMAVPALLVLANNAVPKLLKRGGSTMKISGGKRRGRRGGDYVVPDTIEEIEAEIAAQNAIIKNETGSNNPEAIAEAQKNIIALETKLNVLKPTTGGNMLQQAIVPATLVLASNMFGKRKMSPMPKYTKRRSNRRRLNRRKRVSRRFRRGTR